MDAAVQGKPFLVWRDPAGQQHLLVLGDEFTRVSIGRRPSNEVPIEWDPNVSRLHAVLELIGDVWTVADDGLSRNGSYRNGQRLAGRQRLRNGDIITVGLTKLLYRSPIEGGASTAAGAERPAIPELTATQRQVLVSLCRPCLDPEARRPPSTNRHIANDVNLSVDAVKFHLRALFVKFGVEDLAQNEKRLRLVDLAIAAGIAAAHRPAPF